MLSFRYKVIELAETTADELRNMGLPGLLPLLVLTKGGTTREIIEEIITGLEAAQRRESLPTAQMLASLVFKNKSEVERDWLRRRFGQMSDLLRETEAYQEILQEGREEARRRFLEEQQDWLRDQRETLVNVVQMRFPEIVPLAKKQGGAVSDPKRLQRLINEMLKVPTLEKAVQNLLDIPETDEKAS